MWQVAGQKAVSRLQRSLEADTLAHAYLIVGPAHVGKATLAANLAQALNCEASERPCLECDSCRRIASSGHADVQITSLNRNEDASEAKLISIDQIKQMQHAASLPPFEGSCKVFIIDGAELLSTEAANCLLKTLEEPFEKVVFILLTVNDSLLPETVVSRCQRLEMVPLPAAEVEQSLAGTVTEPERARLIARLSHGCTGWALAASADDSLLQQRDEDMDRMLEILAADCEERFSYVSRLAARFGQNRAAVYGILDLWLDFWRDLMLVKVGCGDMITNVDRQAALEEMAAGYSLHQIRDFIEGIRAAGQQLRQNANPRLALEVLMLDIPKKGGGEERVTRSPVRHG